MNKWQKKSVSCLMVLNLAYQTNPYPNRYEIGKMSGQLNLEAVKIRNWFASQRAKDTRKNKLCRKCRFFRSPIDKAVHDRDHYSRPCVAYFLTYVTNQQNQMVTDELDENSRDSSNAPTSQSGPMDPRHFGVHQSVASQNTAYAHSPQPPHFLSLNSVNQCCSSIPAPHNLQMTYNSEYHGKYTDDVNSSDMNPENIISSQRTMGLNANECNLASWVGDTQANHAQQLQQFYHS